MDKLNGAVSSIGAFRPWVKARCFVGLVLGTMVAFILEKKFLYAAIASAGRAVLSFIGLIHAPEVAWAANPQVALGYLFFGIVCLGYHFLPGAKDPVEVDEADYRGRPLSRAHPPPEIPFLSSKARFDDRERDFGATGEGKLVGRTGLGVRCQHDVHSTPRIGALQLPLVTRALGVLRARTSPGFNTNSSWSRV